MKVTNCADCPYSLDTCEGIRCNRAPWLDCYGMLMREEKIMWKEVAHKMVEDFDGFMTDYTMYRNEETKEYVCVFGDKDIYTPEDGEYDAEFETEEEAYEWFEDYDTYYVDESISVEDLREWQCASCGMDYFSINMGF